MDISKNIVSNTESDTFLHAMRQQSEQPQLLYFKTRQFGKKSIDGNLLNAEAAENELLHFLNA